MLLTFLTGRRGSRFGGEKLILVPSPRVPTYDSRQPEMSAPEIHTERALAEIATGELDVIIMNHANCDMVEHTGNKKRRLKRSKPLMPMFGPGDSAIVERGCGAGYRRPWQRRRQMVIPKPTSPGPPIRLYPTPVVMIGYRGPRKIGLKNGIPS